MPWSLISTRNETVQIARGGWLDALRFIVAFLIILHHFQAAGPEPLAHLINPIFELGGFLLTNFFLIDSGYVLMRVYGAAVDKGRMSPGDFFLKRFLRVVPAHLIMGLSLVGFVLLGLAFGQSSGIVNSKFPPDHRYTGAAIVANCAWLIAAGFAPLVALLLATRFGLWSVGAYLPSGAICTLAALAISRDWGEIA